MVLVRTAPDRTPLPPGVPLVFLVGSIDQGDAPDWQADVIQQARAWPTPVAIANPRRPDWDRSWTDPLHPGLVDQIEWELDHLELATVVLFCFAPHSRAPITLLELGAMLGHHPPERLLVVCPEAFWRYTNVVVTCRRKGVAVLPSLEAGLAQVAAALQTLP